MGKKRGQGEDVGGEKTKRRVGIGVRRRALFLHIQRILLPSIQALIIDSASEVTTIALFIATFRSCHHSVLGEGPEILFLSGFRKKTRCFYVLCFFQFAILVKI